MTQYESFIITKIDPETGNMQGLTANGKRREFGIAVNRDLATNKLSFGVVRHFVDPQSVPCWEDSSPWTGDESIGEE